MKRISMLAGLTISVPNSANPANGPFTVAMTTTQVIADDEGKQIGYPTQQQQLVIGSDFTPDVLQALNAQLAYIGFALMPIVQVGDDA